MCDVIEFRSSQPAAEQVAYDYQDKVYELHGWDSAPVDQMRYAAACMECMWAMVADGFDLRVTKSCLDFCEDNNAHIAAAACQMILDEREDD